MTTHTKDRSKLPTIPDHELLRQIGRGAYGEVWLARSITGQYRAVKVVYRDSFQSPRPFEREFSGIRKFEPVSRTHESQIHILHVGRNEDYFFYVMDLADDASGGLSTTELTDETPHSISRNPRFDPDLYVPRTLTHDLRTHRRLPFERCLEVGLALTTALEHLHRNGLVHRDIKPSNVVFVQGQPKLADIGLVADVDESMTLVGTEGYLPPEGPGKPRADIYSLGKVLYEISTGRDRKEFPEMPTGLMAMTDQEGISELNEIVIKACAPRAEDRYPSASAMHAELLEVQAGKSIRRSRELERRLGRLRKVTLAAIVLGLLTFGGYLLQSRQTRTVTELASRLNSAVIERNQRLADVFLQSAGDFEDRGDYGGALPATIEAWRLSQTNSVSRNPLRYRLDYLIEHSPQLLRVFAHQGTTWDAVFSPDGRTVAVATVEGEVILWDVKTGNRLPSAIRHRDWINSVRFNPQGTRLLTAGDDGTAKLWSLDSGELLYSLDASDQTVSSGEFSPDGSRIITASHDGNARIWDAATGELRITLTHSEWCSFASFSPNGRFIVTTTRPSHGGPYGAGKARIWDGETGEPVSESSRGPINVGNAVFSPDNVAYVASAGMPGNEGPSWDQPFTLPVFIRDTRFGRRLSGVMGHGTARTLHVAYAPDGASVLTVSDDHTGRLWHAPSGSPLGTPMRHAGFVVHGAYSPDGTLVATASSDATARIWDARSGLPIGGPLGHSAAVRLARFSPDGSLLLTLSVDHCARIWDIAGLLASLEPVGRSEKRKSIHHLDLSADDRLLVTSAHAWGTPDIRLWDATTMSPLGRLPVSHPAARAVISPDLAWIAAGAPQNFDSSPYAEFPFLWDVSNPREPTVALTSSDPVRRVAFSPNSMALAVDQPGGILEAYSTATLKRRFPPLDITPEGSLKQSIDFLEFSPVGGQLLVGNRYRLELRSTETGNMMAPALTASSLEAFYSIRFRPDGLVFATGNRDHQAKIWDARTGELIRDGLTHEATVVATEWSPDGRFLATASMDRAIKVWNVESGELALPALVHNGTVDNIRFHPDGSRIIASGWDGSLWTWSARTGKRIVKSKPHRQAITDLAISRDGTQIFTSADDGTIAVTRLRQAVGRLDELTEYAKAMTGRSLDSAGKVRLLSKQEFLAAWEATQKRFPMTDDPLDRTRLVNWHRNRLESTDIPQAIVAPRFHATRLSVLEPDEEEWKRRRSLIEGRAMPDRDPSLPNEMIDLTSFYNVNLKEEFDAFVIDDVPEHFPTEIVSEDGVRFDVRGLVALSGAATSKPWREIKPFPPHGSRIPIGRSVRKIHFLCGAFRSEWWWLDEKGFSIGSFEIRFSDGTTIGFDLRYGLNIFHWADKNPPALTSSAARVVRAGENPERYLVRITWTNPTPEKQIESVHFLSNKVVPAPFLAGITVE